MLTGSPAPRATMTSHGYGRRVYFMFAVIENSPEHQGADIVVSVEC